MDYDAMHVSDLEELRSLRDDGWEGTLIALGAVTTQVQRRMGAAHLEGRPFGSESLRKLVTEAELQIPTSRISKLEL